MASGLTTKECDQCVVADLSACAAQSGEPGILGWILFPVFLASILLMTFWGIKNA